MPASSHKTFRSNPLYIGCFSASTRQCSSGQCVHVLLCAFVRNNMQCVCVTTCNVHASFSLSHSQICRATAQDVRTISMLVSPSSPAFCAHPLPCIFLVLCRPCTTVHTTRLCNISLAQYICALSVFTRVLHGTVTEMHQINLPLTRFLPCQDVAGKWPSNSHFSASIL
jgi:hypothetical protein